MQARKLKLILASGSFILVLAYLILQGFQKSWVYYFTVEELQSRGSEYSGKTIKVSGKVKPGTVQRVRKKVDFTLYELGHEIQIHYEGILPDAFVEEAPVIAEGIYRQE